MKILTESNNCIKIDVIKKVVENIFLLYIPSDAYEACVASTDFDSFEIEACVRFLKTNPPYARKCLFEELETYPIKPLTYIQQPPKL